MKIATLCYVRDGDKTLMVYRNKKKGLNYGLWNGLGGKLEEGETPEECAIRETKEESGLDVSNLILKGVITFPKNQKLETWLVFVFEIIEFSGALVESEEGELQWIENSKILDLKMNEGDKYFLKWMKEDKFFSAKFVYNEDKLLDYSVNLY